MSVALVTGAQGFIGRHVLGALAEQNTRVITIGRASLGGAEAPDHVGLVDVSDAGMIRRIIEEKKPSTIYHLAGTAQSDNVAELYRANVVYACAVLAAARSVAKPPTVVLAGSATEYGPVPSESMPVSEEYPCRPTTHYGISKLAQTLHGLATAADGTPVVVARLFNPVGAGMPESLALGSFVAQIGRMPASGGTLMTGDLDTIRDLTSVTDVARILVALANTPGAYGSVVNVCSGHGISLRELADLMVARANVPIQINFDPARVGINRIKTFVGDPTRLRLFGLTTARNSPGTLIDEIMGG